MSPHYLEILARYDTATICNVIELFEIRPDSVGFMDGRIRAVYPGLPPMVGYAATATFRSSAPPKAGSIYSDVDKQLQQMSSLPGPAVVAFQDLDDPPVGATFGELMCSVYRSVGAAGLVTSGAGRDLPAIDKLRFPVFIGSTVCSHAYSHIVDVGSSVRIGGLVIHNGDLLHGDADGITSIPMTIATEVADIAPEYVAAERILLDFTQSDGRKNVGELMDRRRAVGDAIARLRERVSRRLSREE